MNKVETKATVRLDLVRSPALPEWVRPQLLEVLANRLTKDGVLIVASERHRERERFGEAAHGSLERAGVVVAADGAAREHAARGVRRGHRRIRHIEE